MVRAYDPRPGAHTTLRGQKVKCFGARVHPSGSGAPGEVLAIGQDGVVVACGAGAARFLQVQPAGKKRMSPDEWRRGRGVEVGDRFA